MANELIDNKSLVVFQGKNIRRTWFNDEWKKRGLLEEREYAILTAEISKATFGMTPGEYNTTNK